MASDEMNKDMSQASGIHLPLISVYKRVSLVDSDFSSSPVSPRSPTPRSRAHTIGSSACIKGKFMLVDLERARQNARHTARRRSISANGQRVLQATQARDRVSSAHVHDGGYLARLRFVDAVHRVMANMKNDDDQTQNPAHQRRVTFAAPEWRSHAGESEFQNAKKNMKLASIVGLTVFKKMYHAQLSVYAKKSLKPKQVNPVAPEEPPENWESSDSEEDEFTRIQESHKEKAEERPVADCPGIRSSEAEIALIKCYDDKLRNEIHKAYPEYGSKMYRTKTPGLRLSESKENHFDDTTDETQSDEDGNFHVPDIVVSCPSANGRSKFRSSRADRSTRSPRVTETAPRSPTGTIRSLTFELSPVCRSESESRESQLSPLPTYFNTPSSPRRKVSGCDRAGVDSPRCPTTQHFTFGSPHAEKSEYLSSSPAAGSSPTSPGFSGLRHLPAEGSDSEAGSRGKFVPSPVPRRLLIKRTDSRESSPSPALPRRVKRAGSLLDAVKAEQGEMVTSSRYQTGSDGNGSSPRIRPTSKILVKKYNKWTSSWNDTNV